MGFGIRKHAVNHVFEIQYCIARIIHSTDVTYWFKRLRNKPSLYIYCNAMNTRNKSRSISIVPARLMAQRFVRTRLVVVHSHSKSDTTIWRVKEKERVRERKERERER